MLPNSRRGAAAERALPATSFELCGVGLAIDVEGWPLDTLQLPHLGRGGGEKRRLCDLQQNCLKHAQYNC